MLTADAFSSLRNRGSSTLAAHPPAAAAAADTPAPVPPPVRVPQAGSRLAIAPNYALDTSTIVGMPAIAEEDRASLTELLVLVVTIKCPGADYGSDLYERPKWARVERDTEWYNIVVGGWEDLTYDQMKRIYNSDVQIGAGRSLVSMRVANVQPNNDPNGLELALIIRWISAAGRRREIARSGVVPLSDGDDLSAEVSRPTSKKPLLKRAWETWTDALWGET